MYRENVSPIELRLPQQTNGYDCGIYTSIFAEEFVRLWAAHNYDGDGEPRSFAETAAAHLRSYVTPAMVTEYRKACIDSINQLRSKSK